jgi:hypothetical protein
MKLQRVHVCLFLRRAPALCIMVTCFRLAFHAVILSDSEGTALLPSDPSAAGRTTQRRLTKRVVPVRNGFKNEQQQQKILLYIPKQNPKKEAGK